MWNFGVRVRSREFQYLLHCVSLGEKHEMLELLWKQHADEMQLLESSVFTVCGRECTVEFQPSADMSWQSWACNEVNQAATHPSPYANVHKNNMCILGGTIGPSTNDTWTPYSNYVRTEHVKEVNKYLSTLPTTLASSTRHEKLLSFMAENGIRQLGLPRIGIFADRVRPDPLHCEINAWQHLLDLVYTESVRRNLFEKFIEILSAPVGLENLHGEEAFLENNPSQENAADETLSKIDIPQNINIILQENATASISRALECKAQESSACARKVQGCGLVYLASKIKEHFGVEAKRLNKLPTRLIGSQAISLARHGYRLVDALQFDEESPLEMTKRLAISKAIEYLRNASGLFNRINLSSVGEVDQLTEFCQLYFNILALFFPSSVNVTVWTVGYAIPFHARKLYEEYNIGYGILSLQAKESKHAGIKGDLLLTNRSNQSSTSGKWWQVMRSNYIRSFYLPEHQPAPPSYVSHFKSRTPSHCSSVGYCGCGRSKDIVDEQCAVCKAAKYIIECAREKKLSEQVIVLLKPITCNECNQRFADVTNLKAHTDHTHRLGPIVVQDPIENTGPSHSLTETRLKSMSVAELKAALKKENLSTSGNKAVLVRRLESALPNLK